MPEQTVKEDKKVKKLAVFFPGIGYHCDKPLLYYSRELACEHGYTQCRNVTYRFGGGNIKGNAEKMQEAFEDLYRQAEILLADIDWKEYEDILFISKSIGTIIASAYAQKHGVDCRQILYTPLEQTYDFAPQNAIAFLGTKDSWSNIDKVKQLSREQEVPISLYEDANHSLEMADSMKNIEILQEVMEMTRKYIGSPA